jgi:hypothetical protein
MDCEVVVVIRATKVKVCASLFVLVIVEFRKSREGMRQNRLPVVAVLRQYQ